MITLTTDFGLSDGFVAQMKGVILGINPQVTLVDLCHKIFPQHIYEAAFVLHTSYLYFPAGTIHLVVVDPSDGGLNDGSLSRPIAIWIDGNIFVGPDNGVFSYVLATRSAEAQLVAVHLTNRKYWRSTANSTYRGLDIFAPVAAHLSLGVPLTDMGQPITDFGTLRVGSSLLHTFGE